jgi:AcrR family transcriptional regulator
VGAVPRRRHDRDALLAAAVAVALEHGLATLTFAAVGQRAEVPDRTVVYYFPTKPDLVGAVVTAMAAGVVETLAADPGPWPVAQAPARLRALLSTPATSTVLTRWLELCLMGADPSSPYRPMARGLGEAFVDLVAGRLADVPEAGRRTAAARVLALVDGAMLLELVGLADHAAAAVRPPA